MDRLIVLAIAGLSAIASCSPGVPPPAPAPAQPATAAQPVAATAPASVAPPASRAPAIVPPVSASATRPGNFVPGTIACGNKLCKAGKEVCCGFSGEGHCVERKPFAPGKMLEQKLEPQFQACISSAKAQYSLSDLSYCDDSSDCPSNQVCCTNWGPGSGNSHTLCVPAARDKSNVCELLESCVEGQPCATSDTHCEQGACKLNNATVRCAGVVCEGATPVCCTTDPDKPPACTAAAQCVAKPDTGPFPMANECSGPSSCPKGTVCQRSVMRTYCSGMVDGANARLVCETDKDCPADHCRIWGGKGRPKCVFDTDFSYCTCP